MHRNAWKRACAQRLVDAGFETGEAAITAESLAWLESTVSSDDVDEWDDPKHAADLHLASLELNRDAVHPAPTDPEAYTAAVRGRLAAGADPFRSINQTDED